MVESGDAIQVSKRRLLGLGAAAFVLPVLGMVVPAFAITYSELPENIDFSVLYEGVPVGQHKVSFRMQGNNLVVTTYINILVKVWYLTAFRYAHDAVEVWKSGQLLSVDSTTNDNGELLSVSGHAVRDGFRISGTNGPFLAAPDLLTSNTLWDRQLMGENMMINVQHGGVTGLVVKALGQERVKTPQGAVDAAHFQIITPYYAGSLFFDDKGRWIKGVMERHGESLEYILRA